uniref:DNA-directed RNA polymerase n=1 Tax=Siphoviridae sp. ctt8434 TaxID=2825703 RepID=A0A8S5U1L1_9CAUD|nr:MAG TPA: DNA-directed RNA polymerase [Siphoviridae sp. ctt8434]
MKEYRCMCGKLLFKGKFKGIISIMCRHCKKLIEFHSENQDK